MNSSSTHSLLELLEEIKAHAHPGSVFDGWSALFSVNDPIEARRQIGLLFVLAQNSAEEISLADPTQRPSVEHWRSQLLSSLTNISPQTPWKAFKGSIDAHSINYLRLQARLVSLSYAEQEISHEALSEAEKLLNEAISEIGASDLPPEIKLTLVRRIRSLISAIQDYKFTGNSAVFDQLKAAVFDLAATQQKEGSTSVGTKFAAGLSILANAATVATSAKDLLKPALKLLGVEE